jgi:hypothetical protein
MTWGLQITNTSGEVQIDSAFRNFQIVQEGSTVVQGNGLSYTFTVNFLPVPYPPLFFYRANPASNGAIDGVSSLTMGRDGSGNYTSIRLRPSDVYGMNGSWVMDWFIAAPSDTLSGDAWGIQVFDASQKKVFDSGAKYLNIIDVVTIPPLSASFWVNTNGILTHAEAVNGYYCVNGVRNFRDLGTFFEIYSVRLSNTQVYIGYSDIETCPVLLSGYTQRSSHLIIAQKTA